MSANTRRALSLKDKLDILRKYDRFPKMGQRDAAVRLNILQSVLDRILKNREDIECEALQNESQSRKRKRCGKDDTIEHALKEWFVKVRNKDARVQTGLYFRALPEHTYVLQNDKAKGTKFCKERITILYCASMTGEKKKLLVVGKSKQPRCFKGVKALPVDYTANKNAWMTQEIFY
ncbi:hypothetical protein QTP88_003497 [Uroleucon formosanum]